MAAVSPYNLNPNISVIKRWMETPLFAHLVCVTQTVVDLPLATVSADHTVQIQLQTVMMCPRVCHAECVDDILNDIESLSLYGKMSGSLLTVSQNYSS